MAWNIYPVEESEGIRIAARHELAGEEVLGAINERITALNHAGWLNKAPLLPEWEQGHPIQMFDCAMATWTLSAFFLRPPTAGDPMFAAYDMWEFAPTWNPADYLPLRLTTEEAFNNLYEVIRHMTWVPAGLSSLPHVEVGGWLHSAVQRGPRPPPGRYISSGPHDSKEGAVSAYRSKVAEEPRVLSTSAGAVCGMFGYGFAGWDEDEHKSVYTCTNTWSGLPEYDAAYKVGFGTVKAGDFDVGVRAAMVEVHITNYAGYNHVKIPGEGSIYWGDSLPNPITVGTMDWTGVGPLVSFPLDQWGQSVLVVPASIGSGSVYYIKSYAPWSTWIVPGGAVWPGEGMGDAPTAARLYFGPYAVALELNFVYN